jgi:hypothetical protein
VCGVVRLDRSWRLTKNKDDISRNDRALYAAVESAIRPLLDKARSQASRLDCAALLNKVQSRINESVFGDKDGKAKRGRGHESGTKAPADSGRKHKRAKKEQEGTSFIRKRYRSLRIEFVPRIDGDESQIGKFDTSGTIFLAQEHPVISEARQSGNDLALVVLCMGLVANAATRGRLDGTLPGIVHEYEPLLGSYLKSPIELDGKQIGQLQAV